MNSLTSLASRHSSPLLQAAGEKAAAVPSRTKAESSTPRDRVRVSRERAAEVSASPVNFAAWGNQGSAVRETQQRLQEQGHELADDGRFGPRTQRAVRDFQRRQGLAQDGVVGPQTRERLSKGLSLRPNQFLSEGSQGKKVKGLQTLLNRSGAGLEKDGRFGPLTEGALRDFQKSQGLREDGIVGPETLAALNRRGKPEARPDGQAEAKKKKAAGPTQDRAERKPAQPVAVETKPAEARQTEQAAKEQKPATATPEKKAEPTFGLSPQALARLQRNGKLETLRKLPPAMIERYQKLSPAARANMQQQLSGSTFGVSHRDAFVNGSAMGMNTFDYMAGKLADQVRDGKMSAREADSMRRDLQALKGLSARQREAIADMLLAGR